MMKRVFLLFVVTALSLTCRAQTPALLDSTLVSLGGKEAMTVFKNSSADTLKLNGMFFNALPYRENNFVLTIPPGRQDTLRLQFNFPDFIYINNFRVYNAPGAIVYYDFKTTKGQAPVITYTGSFADQNKYYLAYNQFLGNYDNESRPYYAAGDRVKDWDNFPAMADSITHIRLGFLNSYTGNLPLAFKKNEEQRLLYNGMMRKYNVLASKEFYGGDKVPVKDSYYSFEKDIKLRDVGMVLNTEYLWVTDDYLFNASKKVTKPVPDAMFYAIDSLCHDDNIADLLKMRRLYKLYTSATDKFDIAFKEVVFADSARKTLADSLIQTNLGLPRAGKKAPGFTLADINGKPVSLEQFKGHNVILNFWAVWCGPCIKEFPAENELYRKYKSHGLTVINICVESGREQWQKVSARSQLQMVNLFAGDDTYTSLKRAYNLGAFPRSILIDKDGKVVSNYYKRASAITEKDIAGLLGK